MLTCEKDILSPGLHMNVLCTFNLDTRFYKQVFWVSLSMLIIFLISTLYYACNMLEIIESVVTVMNYVITISERQTRVYHGKNSETAI